MSYVDANASELQGAGSAFILEPTNHEIHPDDQWSTHPAVENVDLDGHKIENLANPTAGQDAVNKTHLDSNFYNQSTADSRYLKTDGTNSMSANLNMDSNKITNVVDPTSAQDGATKNYVDNNADVSKWHQYTASSNVDVGDHKVINVNDPLNNKDAVNLQYFNDNNTIGNIKLKQVTHDDSFTLNDGGQHTDAKTVSGLDNNPYFIRIEILVWGDQLNGLNDSIDLQFLLQDDGFTDQYDPARQAISDGKSNQKFQLTNQTGIGVDGNAKTIYYNFCLLSNATTSLTFNIDVIENGAFTGSMTVNTRLNAFITPASILI